MAAAEASPELFDVLLVSPALGRFFVADDGLDSAAPVVVLSDALWRSRFGSDTGVIGRLLTLDGRPHTIVGVAPPGVDFPSPDVRLWTVNRLERPGTGNTVRVSVSTAIARLRPGATTEQASTEGTAAARQTPRPFAAEMMFGKGGPVEVRVRALVDEMTAGIRPALVVLAAAVASLLLITCANVANLFLSRGVAREREIAVRVALGATRAQLVRQLVAESFTVAVAGGIVGVGVAWLAVRLLPLAAPADLPRLGDVRLDAVSLAFAAATTIVAGLVSGLMPALRTARHDLLPALREAAGASSSARTIRVRKLLLVAESAVAVVMLVGAVLLARSLSTLLRVDPGYDADDELTACVYLPSAGRGPADTTAFLAEFLNDGDPIGFQFPGILTRDVTAEIVGVVGNVLKDGLAATPQPEVYVAISPKFTSRNELNLIVRTAGDPSELDPPVRRALRDVRPDAAIDAIATLESQLSESVAHPRFAAVVVAGFAALALLLSAVGLYSVLAYTVSRRTREIGVRCALGASRVRMVGMVCREGLSIAGIGSAFGLAGAAAVTRLMQSMLFGIESLDLPSFVAAPALLLVVAAVACLIPARRAATLNPTVALRAE